MIILDQPYSFSHIGRKDNQEDFLYPPSPSPSNRIFVLCDGMGGHERGEVASATVATTIASALSDAIDKGADITKIAFDKALADAYDALELLETANSDRKPGTTLAFLAFNRRTVLAAHIGDSRIYQIRPSLATTDNPAAAIVYRSEDHSLVNDLVRAGQITPQQARTHPRRNIITRALQPGLERRFPATIRISSDIHPGDYFFLCSDGLLEQLSDETLSSILSSPSLSDAEKTDAILAECNRGTRDNFTACIIPVKEVQADPARGKLRSYRWPIAILLALSILAALGIISFYAGWLSNGTPSTPLPADSIQVPITDTALIDTIMVQPLPDSLPRPDSAVAPLPPVEFPDTFPAPAPHAADSAKARHHESGAAPRESAPDSTPRVAPRPEAVKDPGAVPPRRKPSDPSQVPPRKKQPSDPKPLA